MPKARFKDSIQVPNKDRAVLMTVISLGNHSQEGQKLGYFVDLVNTAFKEKSLEKLIIVTTGHLQKHYFSLGLEEELEEVNLENKAQAFDQQWLKKNKNYLDQFKLPVEILSWKELLEKDKDAFNSFLEQIKTDYHANKEFTNLVDKHAGNYVYRKINQYFKGNKKVSSDDFLRVATHYVLEECAALVLQLFKCGADLLCYPDGKTPPANYVWNKYFHDAPLKYVRYKLESLEVKQAVSQFFPRATNTPNLPTCYTQWSLNRVQWNIAQQFLFIQELNRLILTINSSEQNEPIPAETKITHRRSV